MHQFSSAKVTTLARAAVFLATLALAGCSSPAPSPAPAAADASADSAAGLAAELSVRGDVPAGVADGPEEMGIGVAYLVQQLAEGERSDTVLIRATPGAAAPVVARYILDVRSGGSWTWRLEAVQADDPSTPAAGPLPHLELNSLEFAYEESGLPLDSLVTLRAGDTSAEWARVIYARDAVDPEAGSSAVGAVTAGPGGMRRTDRPVLHRGWVQLAPGRLERILWNEHLPVKTLFLLGPVQPQFLDAPGGRPVDAGVPTTDTDHIIHPIQRRGKWLQVEVVTPSDYCWEPRPETRRTVAWIPYLDDGGRARVWYFSRGC